MRLLLQIVLWMFLPGSAFASIFETEIYARPTDHFDLAQFRLWVPENSSRVLGVLVLVPGTNTYALQLSDDPHWQKIAAGWNFALLSVYFSGSNPRGFDYCSSAESSEALLEALNALSNPSKHQELSTCPLAMIGHSAGGQFNYHFAVRHPERTLAFVTIKGGYYYLPTTNETREVPALVIAGQQDAGFRTGNLRELFESNRSRGAPWCFAVEPKASHELGRSLELALPFLNGVIPLRLDSSGKLKPVDQTSGYLGDLKTGDTMPPSSYRGVRGLTAWLPDEATTHAWQAFVQDDVSYPLPTETLDAGVPPHFATVDSPHLDFGDIPQDGKPVVRRVTLRRSPHDPPWDTAFCPDDYSWLKVSPSDNDPTSPTFSLEINPATLPLGMAKATVHLRVRRRGVPLLGGGGDVFVTARITGGIRIQPPTLYAGVLAPSKRRTLFLDFTSADGAPIEFRDVSKEGPHPELIQVALAAHDRSHLRMACDFRGVAGAGNLSGKLFFKLHAGRDYTVLVPFVASVPDPEADAPR